MANLVEIMQLCRLCLVKDEVNIPIFEEQGDIRQIFLKISACLPVKVSREDNLPKKICDGCSYKLDILYQFWNTSVNSEKQLLKWLSQIGVEQNSTSEKTTVTPAQSHSINADGVVLKQEVVDLADSHGADELAADDLNVSNEAHDYILQQQQLPYQSIGFQFQQDGFTEGEATTSASGPSATVTSEATESPPKRKRRAAAMKALPPHIDSEEEDEDDVDMVETKIAKTEEQSDDSGAEDPEPTTFVGLPSTSTDNEQPGPSGVGKGSTEGPSKSNYGFTHYLLVNSSIPASTPTAPKSTNNTNKVLILKQEPIDTNSPTPTRTILLKLGYVIPKVEPKIKEEYPEGVPAHQQQSLSTTQYNAIVITKPPINTGKKRYECTMCGRVLSCYRSYYQHKHTVHSDERRYSCTVCSKSFKLKAQLKKHMVTHMDTFAFKCEVCEKSFKTKHSLRLHSTLHQENSKHKCEFCNKSFLYQSILKQHVDTTHNKIFTCPTCNEVFSSNYKYEIHKKIHQGTLIKEFGCNVCERRFHFSYQLKRHLLNHEVKEKKYEMCDICGKTVTSKTSLRNHKLIHEGVKSFQCSDCGKMFLNMKKLRFHARVHTGERPYACEVCKKKFTQRSTLVIHMRSHTGDRPYKCDLCDKDFVSRCALNTHKKSKHKIM